MFALVAERVSLTAAFVVAAATAIPSVLMPLGIRADTRPAREAGVEVTGGPREVVKVGWGASRIRVTVAATISACRW